jgi:hypothetical protein
LIVFGNTALPYCSICELISQLSPAPANQDISGNLVDDCYPEDTFTCDTDTDSGGDTDTDTD